MNLDFNFNETSAGVLNQKDLCFFYYGVGLDTMTNVPVLFKWDEDIQSFIDGEKMTIDGLEEEKVKALEDKFEKDKLIFIVRENETKEESLFRHLRNAFAHYNIRREGDHFLCKDMDPRNNSIKMIGYVNGESLKELCCRFYGQRAEYEESLRLNEE